MPEDSLNDLCYVISLHSYFSLLFVCLLVSPCQRALLGFIARCV